ncbi:unnamed protein product [Blepharisma stoltei]|uniref:Protein YIPF n=1 Tax=Blepharisma stoltei TaxID=1481888 RepID=A0AAU9JCD1_9CILI|nr:unnamed protein product [Blepharisma stoltei]
MDKSVLPPNWEEAKDKSGKVYYINKATNMTSWERPSIDDIKEAEDLSPPNRLSDPIRKCLSCLKPQFDIDTEDIKTRVLKAFNPTYSKFIELIEYRTDLYGPFWIYTTLIVLLASASNFSLAIGGETKNNLEFITGACTFIYLIGFLAPLLIWGLLKYSGSQIKYLQVLCLYGYSLVVYVPSAMLCIIPVSFLRWVFVLYSMVSSAWFLVVNLKQEMESYTELKQKYSVLGLIGVLQLVLGLTFKMYFFGYIYSES